MCVNCCASLSVVRARARCLYLIMCLLRGARRKLLNVSPCCGQVCWKVPHLHGAVLTPGHDERSFHPGQKHMRRWKIISCLSLSFSFYGACDGDTHTCLQECVVLPGAGDGAYSVSVAGALCHTVNLTTVTVHLPHTHRPVLKTKTQHANVTVGYRKWLNRAFEWQMC